MGARHNLLPAVAVAVAVALLSSAAAIGAKSPAPGASSDPAAASQADAAATQPGSWQEHDYQFNYMGFTAIYSCDGLSDKLQLLLRLSGARPDAKVMASCSRGFGVPDKLAQAQLKFSTLQPAPVAAAVTGTNADGVWRHVELSPRHPFELQLGDCELVEQYRDKLLPMFATRNMRNQITCVPNQEAGSNFSLAFDVLAPAPPKPPGPSPVVPPSQPPPPARTGS
jgi:hypothetical protein